MATLVDDVIEEVLLRFPPDDPALLFRATLVCKRWRRLISDPCFRRRFHEFNRSPPVLGFLCHLLGAGFNYNRFYRTSASCPPILDHSNSEPLDSRHGRVLLQTLTELVVWDPITGHRWELPQLPREARIWNVAVLCAGAVSRGSCDHLGCHRGPFHVVFVGTDSDVMFSCVYSSVDGMWSDPIVSAEYPHDHIEMLPGVFVGNALYFVFKSRTKILKYNVDTREMLVIHLPPGSHGIYGHLVLVAMEDNSRLGFVRRERSTLYLWSMEADRSGVVRWTQSKLIDLEKFLPADALSLPRVITFADGIRLLFVMTVQGLFRVDLKSGRAKKLLGKEYDVYSIVPFASFYTPG